MCIRWSAYFKKTYENIKHTIYYKIIPYQKYFFMEATTIDRDTYLVRPYRTKYSYINHSRNPNVRLEFNKKNVRLISMKYIQETTAQ